TARMVLCVLLVMSHGLSTGMEKVAAMSDSSFRKSEEGEEVEESLDSDSKSEDVEDEGPVVEDKDPTTGDEGLAAGVEGLGVDDESYGLGGESYGLDDESPGIDDEGRGIKSDGLGLGEEEVVPKGLQRAVPVVGTAVSEPLGLGYGALRRRELALEEDHVYNTFEVGQGSGSTPESERSERVSAFKQSTLTTWTYLEDATSTATIPVDEDQFIEVGAQLELYRVNNNIPAIQMDRVDEVLTSHMKEVSINHGGQMVTEKKHAFYLGGENKSVTTLNLSRYTKDRLLEYVKGGIWEEIDLVDQADEVNNFGNDLFENDSDDFKSLDDFDSDFNDDMSDRDVDGNDNGDYDNDLYDDNENFPD
nr:hypothetical protein [Tanacetum cinerariifolium]